MDTIEKAVSRLTGEGGEVPLVGAPSEDALAISGDDMHDHDADISTADLAKTQRIINLDLEKLQAGSIVDPSSDRRDQIAEEFRVIKQPLLAHARGKAASQVEFPNLVMVTSALAGEGKTFVSINLALSIAMEHDNTVLLVDSDVAKPEVTKRLGIEAEKGVTDVLLDERLELSDVLIKTDISRLSILPAGRPHTHSTELLASAAMRRLAEELATRYPDRIIIFDSPPLLLTSEARVLAGLMGQVVVVVEQSKTPQPAVSEALSMLDSNEIVGVVINKMHRSLTGSYGRYRYSYGYGYGYGQR